MGHPWCPACGSEVIWKGPPEHCLECGSLDVSRDARPEDEGPDLDGPGLIAASRSFAAAVEELCRLEELEAKRIGDSSGS